MKSSEAGTGAGGRKRQRECIDSAEAPVRSDKERKERKIEGFSTDIMHHGLERERESEVGTDSLLAPGNTKFRSCDLIRNFNFTTPLFFFMLII